MWTSLSVSLSLSLQFDGELQGYRISWRQRLMHASLRSCRCAMCYQPSVVRVCGYVAELLDFRVFCLRVCRSKP